MLTKAKNNIKGISLIILVITILVLSILAATVIINLSGTNVIGQTSKSVLKSNLYSMQDLATMYWADNHDTIDADKDYSITEFGITDETFKDYAPYTIVQAGIVYVKPNAPENLKEVAEELNMLMTYSETGIVSINKLPRILRIYGNSVENTTNNTTESVGTWFENLFNVNKLGAVTSTDYSIEIENNSIILTGTQAACTTNKTLQELCPTLEVGDVATLSFDTTSSRKYMYLGTSKFVWDSGQTRTITSDDLASKLYVYNEMGLTESAETIISNIQIEKGNKVTPYEPYGGKVGYKIPVKVRRGKNLFDINNMYNWKKETGLNYHYYALFVGANKTVTISWDNSLELNQNFHLNIANESSQKGTDRGSWLYHKTNSSLCKQNISVTADAEGYIYINISNKDELPTKLQNFQVELGSSATAYEAYNGTEYAIYLDEPLRKTGNAVDYVDCMTGKVIRNVSVNSTTGAFEALSSTVKEEAIFVPNIDFTGVKDIFIETSVVPSNIEIKY